MGPKRYPDRGRGAGNARVAARAAVRRSKDLDKEDTIIKLLKEILSILKE